MAGRVGHFGAMPPPLQHRSAQTAYTSMLSGIPGSFACTFHPIWWKKRGTKCLGKVATQPALLEKKMNSILQFSPWICDLFLSTPLIGFKLLILFNFTCEELQFKPQISAHFFLWSLVLDLCNQVPNWPSNFNIYSIKPLIWPNQLSKIILWPHNLNQLKLKLT
jgi:hypothetical protein